MNKEVARQWFQKSIQEKGFNKFICLWISLNALYGDTEGDGDKNKCKNYLTKHSGEILALQATAIFIDSIKNRLKKGIINIEKERVELIGEGDIDNIARCIYTIRCNVFHGDKKLYDEDNLDLLDKTSNLLNEFLSTIFV